MFGALKRGFRSMACLILVRNVAGELRPKRTLAASRGFLAAARLSCLYLSVNTEYLENGSRWLKLQLITNRKSHMGFPLTPRSMTLDDLELM